MTCVTVIKTFLNRIGDFLRMLVLNYVYSKNLFLLCNSFLLFSPIIFLLKKAHI
jgi:hypothetical protein